MLGLDTITPLTIAFLFLCAVVNAILRHDFISTSSVPFTLYADLSI